MVILLFGISNVGKTTIGKNLGHKLGFSFLDLDEEIKHRFQITLEKFVQEHPYPYERGKVKGKILRELIDENEQNIVIAVSPIYYARFFNSLLDLQHVIAVELQDSKEHIFERLVFVDDQDIIYQDDAYKNKHKDHYLKEIQRDIVLARRIFKKIENKYFINNRPVNQVVDDLIRMIKNISANSEE